MKWFQSFRKNAQLQPRYEPPLALNPDAQQMYMQQLYAPSAPEESKSSYSSDRFPFESSYAFAPSAPEEDVYQGARRNAISSRQAMYKTARKSGRKSRSKKSKKSKAKSKKRSGKSRKLFN